MQIENHAVGASRYSKAISAMLAGVLAIGMVPATAFAQASENDSPEQADAIVVLANDDSSASAQDGESTTTPVVLTSGDAIIYSAETWANVLRNLELVGKSGDTTTTYKFGADKTAAGSTATDPAVDTFNVTKITAKDSTTAIATTDTANAGTYTLTLTIPGADGKAQAATADVTIAAFNLSNYTAVANEPVQPVSVGTLPTALSDFTITLKTGQAELPTYIQSALKVTSNAPSPLKAGPYTYTIAATGNSNITGSITAPVTVATTVPAKSNFQYTNPDGGTSSIGTDASYTIDVAEGQSMTAADFSVLGASLSNALTLQVTKQGSTTVLPASVLSTPGTYTVQVVIDPTKTSYAYAGSSNPFTVKVTNAGNPVVDDAVVGYVYYNKALVNSSSQNAGWSGTKTDPAMVQYTGKNLATNLSYIAKTADGTILTQGSDYQIMISDAAGNIVTSIVNAGTYKISFVSANSKYENLATNDVYLEVLPAQMTGIRISNDLFTATSDGVATFAPTATGVVPTFEYTTATDPTSADATWQTLPSSAYTLTYAADEGSTLNDGKATEAGSYKVTVTLKSSGNNFVQNYAFATPLSGSAQALPFAITDHNLFKDVPANAWYTSDVYNAVNNEYMRGFNSTTFGPDNTLTRAQAAVVFYNMGGGDPNLPESDYAKESTFKDVAGSTWFTTQINWAHSKGIVTGFGDTGEYRPYNNVTREQFVTMMARFAKAKGIDTTAKDVEGTLAKYKDGASVSGYARNDVAWAIEQDLFGVNTTSLHPQDTLTRAQAAAIAVRQQPKPLTGSAVLVPSTTTDSSSSTGKTE